MCPTDEFWDRHMFDKRRDSNLDAPRAQFDTDTSEAPASQAGASSGRAAVIGPRIRIKGDVTGDENLVVEGRIEGKVSLGDYRVDVGSSGQVFADIEAKVVKVDGEVQGDIHGSEKVIISRSGNVRGNIVAPRMTLEDGAKFKGSIDMDPGEPAPAKPAVKAAAKTDASASANGQGHVPTNAKGVSESLSLKGD